MPILDGFDQLGFNASPCFRCGQKDHRASDATCKGKEGDFQKDAPEWFKHKAGENKGTGNGYAKGKGKGKSSGSRNWKRKGDSGKPPCANYNKRNGYCKWGDNCRFSHDGPKDGKRKSTSSATKAAVKKQKKAMMSMLVKVLDDVEEKEAKPKEKQVSGKERLMQIVRGEGKLVGVVTAEDDERNYVPLRPKPTIRTVLMIGSSGLNAREYTPVDPAKARRSGDVQPERSR
jgi:hypothetical protein